jgi:hypothetical protein
MKAATNFVTDRSLGIHICSFEGFCHMYLFCDNAGVQLGGGVRGSGASSSRPISDRLPTVCSLVIAMSLLCIRHEKLEDMGKYRGV